MLMTALTGLVLPAARAGGQMALVNNAFETGLDATHNPDMFVIPAVQIYMTAGLAVGDFDNDGDQDIYWISGGLEPDKLFINDGSGVFTDEAAAWGLTDLHGGSGAAVGDYNGDGFVDIYVTSFGPSGLRGGGPGFNRLYKNNAGAFFTEVAAEAGVNYSAQDTSSGYGAAWGDYDLDGDLDLVVTAWKDNADGNRLYRNNGDETFTDVTETALGDAIDGVRGFAPGFADMDDNLFPELLVAADFGTSRYFYNNGDGTFTDTTEASGTGIDDNGMGQAVGDFDNNGLLDWYVTSIYYDVNPPGHHLGNTLYMNQGNHQYLEVGADSGTNDGGWGWATIALDLDNNGNKDIIEVNGWPLPGKYIGERAKLFYNNGDGTFAEIAEAAGLDSTGQGRGAAWLDVENDGDLDVLISNYVGPLECFSNQTVGLGNWIRFKFDTSTNPLIAPDGYGTKVRVDADGQTYTGYLNGSPSFLATSELSIHLGLGSSTVIDELRVHWTRGQVTTMQQVDVNQILVLTAPELGDLDADGFVGIVDFLGLLLLWGPVMDPPGLAADLDNDGLIGIGDFLILLANWG